MTSELTLEPSAELTPLSAGVLSRAMSPVSSSETVEAEDGDDGAVGARGAADIMEKEGREKGRMENDKSVDMGSSGRSGSERGASVGHGSNSESGSSVSHRSGVASDPCCLR